MQRCYRAAVRYRVLGLQQVQVQSGRAHQPAVLLFLGHCGGDVDALRLPAGAEADEKGAQPYPSVDDSSAGGIHGGEYAYQRAGTGAVRCPHQRRCAQRPAGSVP